jgi:transposase
VGLGDRHGTGACLVLRQDFTVPTASRAPPAKARNGEVLFADQVGIRSGQVTGRTWGAKGTTPVVRRTGNRFSVNVMPVINTKGCMHFMVFTESFDAKVMCRFLDRFVGHSDRKVHLIVDRHSAHHSKTVRTWLASHKDEIELHFLPSYSPELNPGELVNADLERSLPHTHRARNQAELTAETRRFFHRRQRQPSRRPRILRWPTRPLHLPRVNTMSC